MPLLFEEHTYSIMTFFFMYNVSHFIHQNEPVFENETTDTYNQQIVKHHAASFQKLLKNLTFDNQMLLLAALYVCVIGKCVAKPLIPNTDKSTNASIFSLLLILTFL